MTPGRQTQSAQTMSGRAEWRQNWRIALGASIGVATGFSMHQFSASLFVQPLQESFGWTRGEIAYAHYGSLATALLSPFAGHLLDRLGVRKPLLIAFVLTGLAYLALSTLSGSIWQYYASMLFLQLVGILTTGLAFTRVIAFRFVASRGLALATTRIGISILGIFLPSILQALIVSYGWQAGYQLLGAIALLIGLPVSYFCIIEPYRPERRSPIEHSGKGRSGGGFRLIWRHPKIGLLCLAAGLGYAPIASVLSQLQPLLVSKGLDPGYAAALGGVLAASVMIGTLVSGVLVDRIWAPLVAVLFAIGPCIGLALLLFEQPSLAVVSIAVVTIGMSQGAEIDVVAYLAARYFGLERYSTIYGLTIMSIVAFGTIGQVGIGHLYDMFGDYRVAMILAILTLGASMLCYLFLGPYPNGAPDVLEMREDEP